MSIASAPNVLVLHLKRFAFGGMSDKVNKYVAFETALTLPIANAKDGSNKAAKYSLCGVLVHHGHSVHSGHYISFVKVQLAHFLIF